MPKSSIQGQWNYTNLKPEIEEGKKALNLLRYFQNSDRSIFSKKLMTFQIVAYHLRD